MCPSLANQTLLAPWPVKTFPPGNCDCGLELWRELARAKPQVDAERTSELLVTPGFTHTIPIFPSHKAPKSPLPSGCLSFTSQFPPPPPTQQMFISLFCIAEG